MSLHLEWSNFVVVVVRVSFQFFALVCNLRITCVLSKLCITSKILYFLYNCFQFSIHQQAYVPMFMICTYCNEHDACQIWQIWLKIYRGKIYWKRENSIILALGPPNICMPTTLETSVFWVCWNALQHYMCICVELITLPLFIHDVVCISFRQGLASHDQHSRLTGDLCGIFGVFLPLACFITVLNFVHFSSMTITVVFHRTKPSQCWMRFLYLTHTQFVAVVNLMLCGILYCAVSLMRSNGTVWWCNIAIQVIKWLWYMCVSTILQTF